MRQLKKSMINIDFRSDSSMKVKLNVLAFTKVFGFIAYKIDVYF